MIMLVLNRYSWTVCSGTESPDEEMRRTGFVMAKSITEFDDGERDIATTNSAYVLVVCMSIRKE